MTPDSFPLLAELLGSAGIRVPAALPSTRIRQVTDDSRAVGPGALFVAVRGSAADGHRFAAQAAARGAAAVLVEQELPLPEATTQVRVPSTRAVLGPLAHAFQGFPSRAVKVVGVTGTKGKTTVTWWLHHLLEAAGTRCGLMGTIGNRLGDGEMAASGNTTLGAAALQADLGLMRDRGLTACAMEVSSHALDQQRVGGVEWAAAVFTNLGSEHLDYHSTLEQYFQAKRKLFTALGEKATAVLNAADPTSSRLRADVRGRVITYALKGPAEVTARSVCSSLEGFSAELVTPAGVFPVASRCVGLHHLENLLAAVSAVWALGVPLEKGLAAVPDFGGVPGRMERVEAGQPFPVFVDYAHTDGSLRRVLEELRRAGAGKILTVFGCGGDRDRTKRPRMGRAAAELSDRVLITSDNPRSEEPQRIAEEITAGIEPGSCAVEIRLDRREAIQQALESAEEGWVVLIAGKGHEQAQIFADRAVPFDDRAMVRELWRERTVA